jgi:DNA modification methylase
MQFEILETVEPTEESYDEIERRRSRDNAAVAANREKYRGRSAVQIHNTDCITGMQALPAESVDLVVSSIPFGALFMYSGKTEDIGNNTDGVDLHAGQFGLHMRFFLEQLERVMKPGSLFCCHIQQLDTTKVQHGYMGIRDFRGAIITLCRNHGFTPHGEVAIPKNPQAVAQRRKKHSLMFATGKRDSRMLAPTANDYVLFFRKPGDGLPIRGLYDARENPDGWFSQEDWIKWASGVWDDILEIDVLEGWHGARDSDQEKHVCPLQLEVIRRCIYLYSAPGQRVLDPFIGIGSTAWVAVETGRDCWGFELKESYHRLSLSNTAKALQEFRSAQPELFGVQEVGA